MLKEKLLPFLKKFYPFLLIIPCVLLVLFFVLSIFARDVVITPEGNPFPKGAKYVEDQVIVKYKDGQAPDQLSPQKEESLDQKLSSLGVKSQEKLFTSVDEFLKNYYLLYLRPGTNIQELYKKLSDVPEIDSITPDYILDTFPKETDEEDVPTIQSPISEGEPNDPYFLDGQQWDMTAIDMKKAWDIRRASDEIVIAVIDTGVDYNHPDLVGKVIKGRNYINNSDDPLDDHGHGTHVAGTIAATTNNGIGISSTSWGGKILAVKSCDNNGDCVTSNVVRGVSYALESGAKIINVSIAGIGSCKKENFFSGDRVYEDVIKDAQSKGAIIIVAAGNHNQDARNEVPSACEGVVSVGATNTSNTRWVSSDTSGSNFGDKVDISAPGSPILSTSVQNGYSIRNGTSMAAPHVSGVASLLLSFNKNLTPQEIKDCMVKSAKPIDSDKYIAGMLNAYDALVACGANKSQNISAINPTSAFQIPLTSMPSNVTVAPSDYSISGTVFIDQNANGLFDSSEKTLGGVQVIVSPPTVSRLANPQGYYLFNNLSPNTYLISLTIPDVSSINLPTRTVSLGEGLRSVVVNIPVSPLALPLPTALPTASAQSGPTPTKTEQPSSGCYYEPGCFGGKQIQACSFTCN